MLCGHTTLSVDSAQQFMEQRTATGLVEAPVRLRHVAESETEQEAEILTALIQSSVFRHGRQAALTTFDFRNSDEEILVRMMELG